MESGAAAAAAAALPGNELSCILGSNDAVLFRRFALFARSVIVFVLSSTTTYLFVVRWLLWQVVFERPWKDGWKVDEIEKYVRYL